MGKMRVGHCIVFFMSSATSFIMPRNQIKNKCYCWDEMNEAMKNGLPTLMETPTTNDYEYLGVQYDSTANMKTCICDDVKSVISEIQIMETVFYRNLRSRNSELDEMAQNLTKAITEILKSSNPDNIINVNSSFLSSETSPKSKWKVEVVVKGTNPNIPSQITSRIMLGVTKSGVSSILRGVGLVNESSINFSINMCTTSNPPKAPKDALMDWDGSKEMGAKATYSCNEGYVSISSNSTTDETVTSRCVNEKWEPITNRFRCVKKECSKDYLPELPNYGMTNWTDAKASLDYQQKVLYSCIKQYHTSVSDTIETTCIGLNLWSDTPRYDCIDNDYERVFIYFDYLEQETLSIPKYKRNPLMLFNIGNGVTENWIYVITIPSIIGLLIFILCCLCCTRTDSFLCKSCDKDHQNTL